MEPFDLRNLSWFEKAGGNPSSPFLIDEITIDSRSILTKRALFIALKGKKEDGHCFVQDAALRGAVGAVVEKGFQLSNLPEGFLLLKTDNSLEALQEIALSYRLYLKLPILAITGAAGKTLIKDFLKQILKSRWQITASPESFNSQIGVPLSLLRAKKGDKLAIIESAISDFHEMDRIKDLLEPSYSILTSLEPLHIPTRLSRNELVLEWLKLLESTSQTGWTLLPDHPLISTKGLPNPHFWNRESEKVPYAQLVKAKAEKETSYIVKFPSGREFKGVVKGNYSFFLNVINMAVKAAYLLGFPEEGIEEALLSFSIELMRTEIWKSPFGTTFLNAPYSSDPQSVHAAIKLLSSAPKHHEKVVLFGGIRDGEEKREAIFPRIAESLIRSPIDRLVLFGHDSFNPLIQTLSNGGFSKPIDNFPDLKTALNYLKRDFVHDQTILVKGGTKVPLENLIEEVNGGPSHNLCFIHLSQIKKNLSLLRSVAPHKRVLVMIKAQGYGTDEWQLAKFLEGEAVDILGLSYVDEAIALRRAGSKQSLFVLNAAPDEMKKVVEGDLEVGISDFPSLEELKKQASQQGKKVKVHLHVDTGMSRFGCRLNEVERLAIEIVSHPWLEFEGLMTHLSCGEDQEEDPFTVQQISLFQTIRRHLEDLGLRPNWVHVSNTAGVLRFPSIEENMVRLGLGIFGFHPSKVTKDILPLEPAVTLLSKIVGINTCLRGEAVSYGRSYIVDRDEAKIGILPIGYFDGLHRHYSGKGHVLIRGQKAPMVGKICMDYAMVDLSEVEGASIGDSVLLFGRDEWGHFASPENFSEKREADVHELVTCLGPRIPRIFIQE